MAMIVVMMVMIMTSMLKIVRRKCRIDDHGELYMGCYVNDTCRVLNSATWPTYILVITMTIGIRLLTEMLLILATYQAHHRLLLSSHS